MTLSSHRYWIFDMDGTLTKKTHDFDELRAHLGVTPEFDGNILQFIDSLSPAKKKAKQEALLAYGFAHAEKAQPQDGVKEILHFLSTKNTHLGVLTRNNREVALRTLEVTGLLDFFHPDDILGRDEAPPKPEPTGIQTLLTRWQGSAKEAVIVGDFHFDLHCGKNAGTTTVLVNQAKNLWPDLADYYFPTCQELLSNLTL